MSDDRSTMTISRNACSAMIDAVQCAVIDKGASKATRTAAFSALLALAEAGLIVDTSAAGLAADDGNAPTPPHVRTGLRLTG